jgi:hypothetical protein
MNIDAVMLIPDTNQVEIQREKNLTSDNTIKLSVQFEVQTYYPAYRNPIINGKPNLYEGTKSDIENMTMPKNTKWFKELQLIRSDKDNKGRTDDSKLNSI